MEVKFFMDQLIYPLANNVQYNGRHGRDIFSFCANMTDESLPDPVDRLAAVIESRLAMLEENCLENYQTARQALTNITSWTDGRQWTWQTCTEFGWYQTTNQVITSIHH